MKVLELKRIEPDVSSDSFLSHLLADGKISEADFEEFKMDQKRKYVEKVHKAKITPASISKDKRFRTYIEVDGKRKMLAKTNEKDLIDALYRFYAGDDASEITFGMMFQKFRDYKAEIFKDNTICKYDVDFKRFFKGTKFCETVLCKITQEDCEVFIINRIKDLKLLKRAYEAMWGYMNGTLDMARNKHIIDVNPMDYLQRKKYFRYCVKKKVVVADRIVSSEEYKKIRNRIQQDHITKPNFITGYAVELASFTGMRVGEIAALTWNDIDFEKRVIVIDKAEVYHQTTKTYTIEETKNGVVRYIPITEDIEKLLRQLHEVEEHYGFLCDCVFANEKGRIHKRAMGDCARNKSYQVGIKTKSIHAYRRTINSRMKANGIPTETAAAILGHTEEVNVSNYSYDVTNMDYKRDALKMAKIS